MKRTIEQAFQALQEQIRGWGRGEARPDLRVFVYPPEWEPVVLSRFPGFAEQCAKRGHPIVLEDVGQGFLREVERRKGVVARLSLLDQSELLHDLGWIALSYLRRALTAPLKPPAVCRIFTNTGTLGTFVSYSAIANELSGGAADALIPATVLAFPGEADDRSLNLLRLRVDTNYRVARI